MPNPTITPTITALARELAERTLNPKDECYCKFCRPDMKCMYCLAQAILSALASPPVEAAQGEAKLVADARVAVSRLRDFAREHGMDHYTRDPLVMTIHLALDLLSVPDKARAALATLPPAAPEARR